MGTHFESSYTDARDVLKRTSGVYSKLMGRLEGRREGTQIMPNNELYYWILTLPEFTGIFHQITYYYLCVRN
jgi:hypothetical protein